MGTAIVWRQESRERRAESRERRAESREQRAETREPETRNTKPETRNPKHETRNHLQPMLSNYLKIAWRNLKRQRLFSFLNLLGLAIGMAACLLILEYVQFERGFDDFHEKKERIFRVKQDRFNHGELSTEWAGGCAAVGFEAKANLPEVEAFTTLHKQKALFSVEDKHARMEDVYFATEDLFKVFSYKLISGDPQQALKEPFTMVIPESVAKRFFGEVDPMGKTIQLDGQENYRVTGVIQDPPGPSHLHIDAFLSFETFRGWEPDVITSWQWDGFLSYLLLAENTDPLAFLEKLNQLVQEKEGENLTQYDSDMKFHLQAVRDIHLNSDYMAEAETNGDGEAVNMLSLIAIFILLIAWINYINLSTARSIRRAREVGLRKTTGASNGQLISQFLLESFMLNIIAAILALTLYQIFRPYLIEVSGTPAAFSFWVHPVSWLIFLLMLLLGSFLAGLYPAFVLSSFQPAAVLKGTISGGKKGIKLRKGLVIFQFALSSLLIAGTLTVYQQLQYMKSMDLGVKLEQRLIVRGPMAIDSLYRSRQDIYYENLLKNPHISQVAFSSSIPGDPTNNNAGGIRRWGADASEGNTVEFVWMDHGYIDLYNIPVVAGRNFDPNHFTDTNTVILNQSGVALLGFSTPEDIIGQELHFWGEKVKVIGVIQDYNHKSLKVSGRPTICRYWPYLLSFQSILLDPHNLNETLSFIEKTYQEAFPNNPYEAYFADEYFNRQYLSDQRFSKVFGAFSILAILIACLGLFGLASYALSRRSKEMGIRKVLGANVTQLTTLISREFILLIVLANVIALPLAGWGISEWLSHFPYRMDMHWTLFLIPFVLILLVAMLTISSQTFKAANTNPVEALRSE